MIDCGKLHLVDITKPFPGAIVYINKYWNCINDETQALYYEGSPQCSSSEQVMKRTGLARDPESVEDHFNGKLKVVFVPVAYTKGEY